MIRTTYTKDPVLLQGDQGVVVEAPCPASQFLVAVSFHRPAVQIQLHPSFIYLMEDGAPPIACGLQPEQVLRFIGQDGLGNTGGSIKPGDLVTVSGAANMSGCILARSQHLSVSTRFHLSELTVPPWNGPAASELAVGTEVGMNCWFRFDIDGFEVAPGMSAVITILPAAHARGDDTYIVSFAQAPERLQALNVDQIYLLAQGRYLIFSNRAFTGPNTGNRHFDLTYRLVCFLESFCPGSIRRPARDRRRSSAEPACTLSVCQQPAHSTMSVTYTPA